MAIKEVVYKDETFAINYEIKNPNQKESILFLHGLGSNKEVSKSAFFNLFKTYKHIYIDMPGFGKSKNENQILTTNDYFLITKEFLKQLNTTPKIIAGHSFGGKVATLLKPELLVLLSSAGIVPQKSFKVRAKIKLFKLLKLFGLGSFYKLFASKDVDNMSQNMYETFKNVVDEKFDDIFKSYDGKALLFWGKEDRATPLKSGEIMHSYIKQSQFFPLDGDHYFFLKPQNAKYIEETIDGLF